MKNDSHRLNGNSSFRYSSNLKTDASDSEEYFVTLNVFMLNIYIVLL